MITGINHITVSVKDIQKSFTFYKDILELKPLCLWPEGAYFLAGNFWFCLSKDTSHSPNNGYTHFAFSVDPEYFQKMKNKIKENNVPVWKKNKSEGDSIYILDPDGHKLEIHVGDWQSRLQEKKKNPWPDTQFFI